MTGDYFVTLIVFGIFSSVIFSLAKDNLEKGITIFSIIMFLILFSMIYSNMNDVAFKEKRPQYKINPSPYKGFFYGFLAVLPIFVVQLLYYVVRLDENLLIFKRRVLQVLTAPLYWLASLISGDVWAYHLVLLVIPVIAGLGYLAGYHEFYITSKMKIFNKLKQQLKKPRRK